MCKNLMIAGVKPDKQDELEAFMTTMAPLMSANDKDGLGYIAMSDKGLWGERWLINAEAFRNRKVWSRSDQKIKEDFKGTLEGGAKYNCFQEPEAVNEPTFAVIMHARFATCEKSMANVHPFYRDGVGLIHNGVISNVKELKQITSTCDSECILNSYVEHGVAANPDNIAKVGHDLVGGYTCGVLTKDKDGNPILDIFRSQPTLYACFIPELDALVFCTSSAMVVDACKELQWKTGNFFRLKDDDMVRLDARTGRFLSHHKFKSTAWSQSTRNYNSYYGDHDGEYGGHHDGHGRNPYAGKNTPADLPPTITAAAPTVPTQETVEAQRADMTEKKSPVIYPKVQELTQLKRSGGKMQELTSIDASSALRDLIDAHDIKSTYKH